MVSFLMAFGFMSLQNSDFITCSVIGALCGVILILTVWCIWTSWRKQESSEADKPKRTSLTLTFEEDHAKIKQKGFEFMRSVSEDLDTSKQQPTERSASRSMSFTNPLKKLRRDTSKKSVEDEESIEIDVVRNEQPDNIRSLSVPATITTDACSSS